MAQYQLFGNTYDTTGSVEFLIKDYTKFNNKSSHSMSITFNVTDFVLLDEGESKLNSNDGDKIKVSGEFVGVKTAEGVYVDAEDSLKLNFSYEGGSIIDRSFGLQAATLRLYWGKEAVKEGNYRSSVTISTQAI